MKAMSEYGVLTKLQMVEPTYLHLPGPVEKKNQVPTTQFFGKQGSSKSGCSVWNVQCSLVLLLLQAAPQGLQY